MSPLIAARPEADIPDTSADELRSQMYADREFMLAIRRGYLEGLRGKGVTVEEYYQRRGLA